MRVAAHTCPPAAIYGPRLFYHGHYRSHAVNRERTLERLGCIHAALTRRSVLYLRLYLSDQRNRNISFILFCPMKRKRKDLNVLTEALYACKLPFINVSEKWRTLHSKSSQSKGSGFLCNVVNRSDTAGVPAGLYWWHLQPGVHFALRVLIIYS